MSRIGRSPVFFDKTVQITLAPGLITVKGPKTVLKVNIENLNIKATIEDGHIILTRANETKQVRALHGVYRSLLQNAVTGVSKGFSKSLELVGVGYRANVKGKFLELTLGYSHPIEFPIPDGIEIKVEKQTLVTVSGANKEAVGQAAAKIRGFREPEPYLGKGVKYTDEIIRKKAGKTAGK